MSLNVPVLRSSFAFVIEKEPQLVARFYEILFERYPQVEPMFHRKDRQKQVEMLSSALVAVLDHLDDAAWLTDTLAGLGRKHVDYGVTAAMYDAVNECLRAAMAEACGDEWTSEIDLAWAAAITAISDLMLRGAERAAA